MTNKALVVQWPNCPNAPYVRTHVVWEHYTTEGGLVRIEEEEEGRDERRNSQNVPQQRTRMYKLLNPLRVTDEKKGDVMLRVYSYLCATHITC